MHILIVGHFDMRLDNACSLRVRGIAAAAQRAGHIVSVIDFRPGSPSAGDAWQFQTHISLPPIHGFSLDEHKAGLLHGAPAWFRGLLMGDVTERFVRDSGLRPDAIMLYGTHLGYMWRMKRLARDFDVPLLLDIVEWYSPEDLPGGRIGPFAITNSFSMRHASLFVDGYSVISQRLASHYARARKPMVILPPIFEPTAPQAKFSQRDERIHFGYAGSPGRKEALGVFFDALSCLKKPKVQLSVHLVGLSEHDVNELVPNALASCAGIATVHCYGRVPNEHSRKIIASCDFSILLRPLKRSNQFGFPSKLAESMAVGTPVFANLFSDLQDVLKPKHNAVIVENITPLEILKGLNQVVAMDASTREAMAQSAWMTACSRFSPLSQAAPIDRFVKDSVAMHRHVTMHT
jgi:glycosyltransferase involved in cell wall biosynthesis